MARTNRHTTVLAGVAFVAAATLLTACQGSDSGKADKAAGADKAAPSASASASSQSGDTQQESARTGTGTGAGTAAKSGGVNGTWFGNVSYLAPGKFTVSGLKGKQQAFFVSDSTLIEGTGDICGQDGGKAQKCTEDELEAAAKKGVSAKVILKNGVAVSVIDDA